jgi:Ca-activated chloride channel family protein
MKIRVATTHCPFVSFMFLLLVALAGNDFSMSVRAQSGAPLTPRSTSLSRDVDPSQSIHVDVDLTLVNVSVTDPYDRSVTGLEKDNFRIFEDNIEQEVLNLSSEDVPISIGIILDLSGSMADKVGRAKESAFEVLKTANPLDEAFLVTFSDRAALLAPFTSSVEDLTSRLVSASARGRTALLDATYLGLSEMRKARNSKRALLIISDGGDNNSRYNENDIKRLVREADTQIYSIGIFEPLEYRSRTQEELNGPSLLNEITDLTGGRAFNAINPNELPDIVAKIGAELRYQYTLAYRSSNRTRDAGWRKIKIKLRTPKGLPPLSVYAKKGYRAPSS